MQYRVLWYHTKEKSKYEAERMFDYLCDRDAAFYMWYYLTKELKYPHVYIYDLVGNLQKPEKGIDGLSACHFV